MPHGRGRPGRRPPTYACPCVDYCRKLHDIVTEEPRWSRRSGSFAPNGPPAHLGSAHRVCLHAVRPEPLGAEPPSQRGKLRLEVDALSIRIRKADHDYGAVVEMSTEAPVSPPEAALTVTAPGVVVD